MTNYTYRAALIDVATTLATEAGRGHVYEPDAWYAVEAHAARVLADETERAAALEEASEVFQSVLAVTKLATAEQVAEELSAE